MLSMKLFPQVLLFPAQWICDRTFKVAFLLDDIDDLEESG